MYKVVNFIFDIFHHSTFSIFFFLSDFNTIWSVFNIFIISMFALLMNSLFIRA